MYTYREMNIAIRMQNGGHYFICLINLFVLRRTQQPILKPYSKTVVAANRFNQYEWLDIVQDDLALYWRSMSKFNQVVCLVLSTS